MTIPHQMSGFVLTGHGGPEKLEWRDNLPVPIPADGEVLIRVLAAAVNNTDINTRIGWYSKSVNGPTDDTARGLGPGSDSGTVTEDGGRSGSPLSFPRIQGADCCGEIVAVGPGVDPARIGERILVRTLQTTGAGNAPFATWTFGSECDGSFAEYTKTFSNDALVIESSLSDAELATFPCAYSTAETMLQRADVGAERVLITGASGGVGSAAIQLAKRRGATVTAITSEDKTGAIARIGADHILMRGESPEPESQDVVIDLVGGAGWPDLIEALRRGGRYSCAGAIAGPLVAFDLRTLYLKDLSFFGSTWQPANILPDIIDYIERGEIRPLLSDSFALRDLPAAQARFLEKTFIGKIALLPA